MRQLKFRSLNNRNSERERMDYSDKYFTLSNEKYCNILGLFFYEMEHYPIMQYTELKDENGEDIYEGDIVILQNDKKAIAEYRLGSFNYVDIRDKTIIESVYENYSRHEKQPKIIGNIYENKELLNV